MLVLDGWLPPSCIALAQVATRGEPRMAKTFLQRYFPGLSRNTFLLALASGAAFALMGSIALLILVPKKADNHW